MQLINIIYRCSKKYIWGFEYYAEKITAINYRGHENYLWKADYASLFMKYFPDLKYRNSPGIELLARSDLAPDEKTF